MRKLLVVLSLILSMNVMAQKPTAIPGHDGITLVWLNMEFFGASIYRGTSPDNYELLEAEAKSPYLDKTAESGVQYYYKIVAETKEIAAMTEIPQDVLFIRDFRTEAHVGTPTKTNDDIFSAPYLQVTDIKNRGLGILTTNNKISSYERYLSNVVPGKQYIAKITYGGITGTCKMIKFSLSERKPVADVIINNPGKELQDTTQEYTLVGGPQSWNTFYVGVQSAKSNQCIVWIKRIEIFGK